jgi:hypothetical protein
MVMGAEIWKVLCGDLGGISNSKFFFEIERAGKEIRSFLRLLNRRKEVHGYMLWYCRVA